MVGKKLLINGIIIKQFSDGKIFYVILREDEMMLIKDCRDEFIKIYFYFNLEISLTKTMNKKFPLKILKLPFCKDQISGENINKEISPQIWRLLKKFKNFSKFSQNLSISRYRTKEN